MDPNQSAPQQVNLTPEYLAAMTKEQLLDLLSNRTRLFMVTMTSHIKDREYVEGLEKDIKAIPSALKDAEAK